ncbi:MAG: AI-2E family transporter [Clostridiales bacterium]|nr:AI-2E family transporter [Clostridiales bacterium]
MKGFRWDKKYLYWGVTALLVIIACIAFFWVLQRWSGIRQSLSGLYKILSPIIGGFALAYLLTPFVKAFEMNIFSAAGKKLFKKSEKKAKSFSRGMSVFASVLLLFLLLFSLFSLVFPQLYASIENIVLNLSSSIRQAELWADKWLEDSPELEQIFKEIVGDAGAKLSKWARDSLLPQMDTIIVSLSAGVLSAVKAVANFFVAVAVSIYVMFNRELFIAQGKKLLYSIFKARFVNNLLEGLRFTDKAFMGYFGGTLLDSLIIGVICFFGCLIMGLRDSVLISVIIGVTNIIPFFGPFIGAVPSALIILMESPWKSLAFVIFIIVLQQFDGNILKPKILGKRTGISGFWVLFAIIVGAGIFGPIGMIIGVPAFAVLYEGAKRLVNKSLANRGLPTETESYSEIISINPQTLEPVLSEGLPEKETESDNEEK